jgi:hypothetical protein
VKERKRERERERGMRWKRVLKTSRFTVADDHQLGRRRRRGGGRDHWHVIFIRIVPREAILVIPNPTV